MPLYEYRCRACGDTLEELRSADAADEPVPCGCGVADTVRLPSMIARSGGDELPLTGGGGGGCCGGGCCA
jgi:putative FmdB family regulatory protein